jgi:hypothetical protein
MKRGYELGFDSLAYMVVHEVGSMNFEGNIIPASWFEHLRYDSGKPHVNAIIILSEVVYWYRPIEIRDERTGRLTGYRKKFKGDKLQRSYGSFAEQFGFTPRQARSAIEFLKDKGVVTTELRTIEANGARMNNVLFLEPVPERLKQITYSRLAAPSSDMHVTPSDIHVIPSDIQGTPSDMQDTTYDTVCQTNTEITTETTTETRMVAAVLTDEQKAVLSLLLGIGMEPAVAEGVVRQHDLDVVRGWIVVAEEAESLSNPAGFVISRLRGGKEPPRSRADNRSDDDPDRYVGGEYAEFVEH